MRRPCSAPVARACVALLLTIAFCFISPAPNAEEHVAPAGSRWDGQAIDLGKLFDAVVDTVDKRFFDEALLKQIDWRGRASAVRPSVVAAPSTADAVRQINALLAELKTSHTALFTPDDYEYYILLDIFGAGPTLSNLLSKQFWGMGPYYSGIGAFTREIAGRHFVDGILEGSPADQAGLKYGDEILSVDGMPYSPIAVFRGKVGTTAALAIRRDVNAAPQRLDISVIPVRPTLAFAAATTASARVVEQDGRRIGYVHIWASSESDSFKAALSKLEPRNIMQERLRISGVSRIPGRMADMTDELREMLTAPKPLDFLIVDLRGRVGGNIGVADQYLELLDGRDKPYWGNNWRSIGRSGSSVRIVPGDPKNPPFRGRSALLVDHHTRSAAELMAHGYKRSGFGPLIGTQTAGAVSAGALSVMPGDLLLYVAIEGREFDGEQRLEGVGVAPDHRVERPLPYAAGADPVIEAAVDVLIQRSR